MKNKTFLLSAIISSCFFTIVCSQATAQTWDSNMPNGQQRCSPASKCTGHPNLIGGNHTSTSRIAPGTQPTRAPQAESFETIMGTVKSVNRVPFPDHVQIQLILTTNNGQDVLVVVGPSNFIDQSLVKVNSGDRVTITGFRLLANGQQVFKAAQIQKNGATLKLLDEKRQPLWRQQMRGRMQ
jgi:hypothetical protein